MTLETLLVVGAGAVLAPLLVEFTPGIALPVVVVELLLGILAGPVLGVAEAGEFLRALAGLGLALYSSTTLPLVVAITAIATAGGHMDARTAAALVGAGMLAVVMFPAAALALGRRVPTFDRAARMPVGA